MVSIIIPVYNEEEILSLNYQRLKELSLSSQLICVDGGSSDRSREIARGLGILLASRKGRARQMNTGAGSASGDILLFLHADTFITPDSLSSLEEKVLKGGVIGGCFTQRIDKQGLAYRLIEGEGNFRAKARRIFYGDQGIFVKREIFSRMGGFADVPIMEDVIFTRRIRALGKTAVLPDKIMVSARRWEKEGLLKTAVLYSLTNILFCLGFSPARIKRLYADLR